MGNELGSPLAHENKTGKARTRSINRQGRSKADSHQSESYVRDTSPGSSSLPFRTIYKLDTKIGEGSHSQVFLAVERATGRRVAAKAIHKDWLDRRRLEFLHAEIEIHQEVSAHPFIVRLLGIYDDPDACFIVEELAQGGSLLAHLHSRVTMGTEGEVRVLLRRLLMAAQFLHERGIVHRDIKPENLLIMEDGMSSAKLADFGFALRIFGEELTSGPACGTPEYVAPEILLRQPFGGKADIWSAGVTAFCLLTGSMPFRGLTLDKLYTAILDGACSYSGQEWTRISPVATDFVQRMLQVDVECRWSAAQLLHHPWMTDAMGPLARPGLGKKAIFGEEKALRRPRVRLRAVAIAVLFANSLVASAASDRTRVSPTTPVQQHELGSP